MAIKARIMPNLYLILTQIMSHSPDDLVAIFRKLFFLEYKTVLVRGEGEPVYLPANGETPARIEFAHGFYASALHEISHWFVAGEARRKLEDFGYWYVPDGRNEQQQQEFFKMEVKPQALEWILSQAAGLSFRPSLDNLGGAAVESHEFKRNLLNQAHSYLMGDLGERPRKLVAALCAFYDNPWPQPEMFYFEDEFLSS